MEETSSLFTLSLEMCPVPCALSPSFHSTSRSPASGVPLECGDKWGLSWLLGPPLAVGGSEEMVTLPHVVHVCGGM